VDRALSEIRHLADTMRDTFQVLSARLLEEQRDRREQLQRRIEIAAAAFLVPTLIVGFYGANTRVPGQGTWQGFWGMVVALVVLSALSVAAVWWWQQRRGMRD
jgi:Mg2+ and Co2+ transporter CorA